MDADWCRINKLENGFKGIKTVNKTPAVLSSSFVYTKMHLEVWLSGCNTYYQSDHFIGTILTTL